MAESPMFDAFKRRMKIDTSVSKPQKIAFRIALKPEGACLEVVNLKGEPVDVSYLTYSGAVRNLLRAIDQIEERNSFVIDWEHPEGGLYLAEHEYLVDLLRGCDNVVNEAMQPIHFADAPATVRVLISEREESRKGSAELLETRVQLRHGDVDEDDFYMLNERNALAGTVVWEVPPMGDGFRALNHMRGKMTRDDLPLFLSLLFSNLEQVGVYFKDYKVVFSKEKVYARGTLIFEKVDEQEALYLRVGQSLADMGVDVLEQFDLYRYAEINDLEKTVTVKYLEQAPLSELVANIENLLKKHRPKGRKGSIAEVHRDENLFIVPSETASAFIYNELPSLLAEYLIFGSEKLKRYKISSAQPSLKLNMSHGIDFFEGDVQVDFGNNEQYDLFDVISQYQKKRYVQLSDGSHALLNEAYVKRLERLFNKKGKKTQLSFFDLPLVEDLIAEEAAKKVFSKSRKVFEGFNELSRKRPKLPELKATMRKYQIQGYQWMKYLRDNKLGGCLADDMGLGKTLQSIALLADAYPGEKKPSLIIMPRSLLFNWKKEVEKFAPQLSTYTFYGLDRDWDAASKAHLILTTYATMRNEIETLKEKEFYYVLLDESQNIKNIQAQTTKAAMLLKSEHRLALSGTPIENNLGELYSLFHFLNPAMFGSLKNFNEHYLAPIQKDNDQDAVHALRKKIYPFVLRRLKKDVLTELPDKTEQTLLIEMSDEQRTLYEQRRQFYQMAVQEQIQSKGLQQSRFFVFQALNELRQIASIPEHISDKVGMSPKRELLMEQLMEVIGNGRKALIFVNYLAAVELISEQLDEQGIDFVSMTGSTRDRQSLVNRFQNDPNCRVFLMTLKTGGTGLNLTAADTIFIFDPWWNVAAENQAIDRAHRIGQSQKVMAYKLITEGSIEEKILKLQELKKSLFDNIITADSNSMKSLSEEDINFILG
jgi:SNF2 family DNA or RNA helicase